MAGTTSYHVELERTAAPRGPLDLIFRTASHVRVLRALVLDDGEHSLSGRDLARRAGIAHPTAFRVLRDLERVGIVRAHRTRVMGVFDINLDHYLAPAIELLFDEEVHVEQAIIGAIRHALRERHRTAGITLRRLETTGAIDVVLKSRRLDAAQDGMWLERLADEIGGRFGEEVDIRVARRGFDVLRGRD